MLENVYINSHKLPYGTNSGTKEAQFKDKIKRTIQDALNLVVLRKIDVYNLDGVMYDFKAGASDRACIFTYATRKGADNSKVVADIIVGNEAVQYNLLAPRGDGMLFTSENGVVVAEYFHEHNEMYILIDLFKEETTATIPLFEHILKQWYELHFKVLEFRNSWKHTTDKTGLTNRFKERMQESLKRSIKDGKDKIRRYENDIEEYKRNLVNSYNNINRLMRNVESDEKGLETAGSSLISDLDLIIAHEKVSDLHIKDGKFIVFIPSVYAFDEKNNRYYIGNCRVEITLENADVRFFGDNPRKSYWSDQDPHPHVKGRDNSGTACLGNVSATIAELASQNQIYALVLVCIDFLESVNTSDSAGKNIVNWDMVDANGNIIKYGARQPQASPYFLEDDDIEEVETPFDDEDGEEHDDEEEEEMF